MCEEFWIIFAKAYVIRYPGLMTKKLVRCELQPFRNAGDTPECWYHQLTNSTDSFPASEWLTSTDCLYLNGSSYHGNISVTVSGIPCQSWTEQCPHRHTMNTTYPELNQAKNYCRNPKNSGRRPWCFTTDRKKRWEYCDIPNCTPVPGSYGNWSMKSACNATCGRGFETWTRDCDNPWPKYGGRNCSHLGEPVEYRPCWTKYCPVNGGYSKWNLSIRCSVSCGEGVEIWRRTCDNPEPKYHGRGCGGIGNSTEIRKCSKKPCPIDGSYSNWTKASPCSVTCGKGVELWIRHCDNPPGKFDVNCYRGLARENRSCVEKPCSAAVDSEVVWLIVSVAFMFVVVVTIFILITKKRRNGGSLYYAFLHFSSRQSRGTRLLEMNNLSEGARTLQEARSGSEYQNMTSEGDSALNSRGVVSHRNDYVNTRPSRISWYDKLQSFRPLAVDWLRNAWGDVDSSGRHAYDVMQHNARQVFVPYDKLAARPESSESGTGTSSQTYSRMERPLEVISPTRS
ncbi:SCO-spondin-like [Dendronephthya gigantea]|uniref:SCO-spondin-like n=1 Tax=Dendronephthya gigantea TaxID=151771 RepID=UPI00106BC7C8|nr:SCO-spondin-like [Dendronephthya gigantea]